MEKIRNTELAQLYDRSLDLTKEYSYWFSKQGWFTTIWSMGIKERFYYIEPGKQGLCYSFWKNCK